MVRTDDENGELREYEIPYTFGFFPLQQYLVAFPGGRYQALSICWDSRPAGEGGQRWYHLYPDGRATAGDILHWTGVFQNWNAMCASCHSTNLEKDYDSSTDSYRTTWSELNVACEACHGPGSRHVTRAEEAARSGRTEEAREGLLVSHREPPAAWVMNPGTGIARREPPRTGHTTLETCAPCHSRRAMLVEPHPFGRPFSDSYRPALLGADLYHPDGQIDEEVYVYGSFLQSRMYAAGVTCTDCHDPHRLGVRAEGNALCNRCHLPEKFDSPTHTFHAAGTPGSACVDCHMPLRTYMGVDPRRDHSFRVPRPDLSLDLEVPNACNECHADRSPRWALDTVRKWYGPEAGTKPHYGRALAAAQENRPGAKAALIAVVEGPDTPGIARATALSLLRLFPTESSMNVLRSAGNDPDPLVRAGAVEGLEGFPPETRAPLALPLLRDESRLVRTQAARSLAGLPQDELSPDDAELLRAVLGEYRAAQELNADRPENLLSLGLLDAELGNLRGAEASYLRAIETSPGFLAPYVNLADLYRLQGRDREARAILERALVRDPTNPELQHALGLTLAREGDLPQALDHLRKSAEGRPESSRFAYVYGIALKSAGRPAEAIRVLEEAQHRHPADPEILFALATLERDRGNLMEARRHARSLVELYPEDIQARDLLRLLGGD
jgi:tetratricopeptide (TPR) repeat protein